MGRVRLGQGSGEMTVEQVRRTLRERIARGAPLSEIDTLLRMSRGIGQRQREALWAEAVRYDPRRVTLRQVDSARRFLTRSNGNGASAKPRAVSGRASADGRGARKPSASTNGRGPRTAAATANGRASRKPAASPRSGSARRAA